MNSHEILLIPAFFALVLMPASFLRRYCFKVVGDRHSLLSMPLAPLERVYYRLLGVDLASEQDWKTYILVLLTFNLVGLVPLFSILMLQGSLPLNPQHLSGLEWTLTFNTAVSFVISANWRAYSDKASLNYLGQMVGLVVQNFVSAAISLYMLVTLTRDISHHSTRQLGNLWADLTCGTPYVLLSLCLLPALPLIWQDVSQTFFGHVHATILQGAGQTIPLGSAASWIAIKQLGTNDGGFFGVNSAHPFENPSAWNNLFEMTSIVLIPTALVLTFDCYVRDLRQSRAILGCMLLLFCFGLGLSLWVKYQPNPMLAQLPVERGAPMEGKGSRFGTVASILQAITTTATSNDSINAMHDSPSPLGDALPLLNMMLGEVTSSDVGAGFYGMLLFVLIAVSLVGLMVGRTPEYLGKKLKAKETRLLVFTLLVMPVGVLVLGVIVASLPGPASVATSPGPRGFSQLFYAYTSGSVNSGSAFVGLGASAPFHNLMIGLAVLISRFGYILSILAIADSLTAERVNPVGLDSFPAHGPLLVSLPTVTILPVGGLTFPPTLVLSLITEQLSPGS